MKASEESIEFWINTFCYLIEPRSASVLPFVTFDFQDDVFRRMERAKGDIGIEKSRDMGASWMVLTDFTWRWLFRPNQKFLLVSRTEDDVDKKADSDSLMWKIDFLLSYLPDWMKPEIVQGNERTRLHLENPVNGSVIDGRSTTGNVGRGGRRTRALVDEFAAFEAQSSVAVLNSLQAVTNHRIFNSTPQGASGGFFDVMHNPDLDIDRIRLHWSIHPLKNEGLYTAERNGGVMALKVLDKDYQFEADYPFILDGKLRSPWYDRECRRAPLPQMIGQELDIDYFGSDFQFFDAGVLQALTLKCFPATYRGFIDYTRDTLQPTRFEERERGPLSLWCPLVGGRPVPSVYVMGQDISGGTGSSNSVCSIVDALAGRKVGEFVTNRMDPKEFARTMVALGRWFKSEDGEDAFMVWESNGAPGRNYGDEVWECGYRNFYYRDQEEKISKVVKKKPGWYTSPKSKTALLLEYKRALTDGEFTNPSEPAIKEASEYVYTVSGGSVEHSPSKNSLDLSDKAEFHGDRVIGDALAWHGTRLKRRPIEMAKPTHSQYCTAARIEAAKQRTRDAEKEKW